MLEALNILEQEKNISKDTLLEAIENSLVTACKNHFGSSDNVKVSIDPETCEFHVFQEKTVVETVEDPVEQISLVNAKMINSKYEIGDVVNIEVQSKEFGRIATQNAKNVILQKIREEERKVLYDQYYSMEKDVVTGVVQRYVGRNVSINLGRVDAILTENEQVKGEVFQPTERIKVYILEVKATSKGPKVLVSRTHPELVKRLFESEVAEAEEKSAKVVVPDYQLSLAIGKEGQNARLAARLTGFKIDIKSETQARESGDFLDYENDYEEDEYYDEDGGSYEEYEDGSAPAEESYEEGSYETDGAEENNAEADGEDRE